MSSVFIEPVHRPIQAVVNLPGSKSISNRALLLGALAQGNTKISNLLFSDDTAACMTALNALGIALESDGAHATALVSGGFPFPKQCTTIDCRDSGIVLRFLLAILAAGEGEFHFIGSQRLGERPLKPLLEVLTRQGARFQYLNQDYALPFILHANGLKGGEVALDVDESSQFLSGLMLAAPYAKTPLSILSSLSVAEQPYVKMTVAMMENFGVKVSCHGKEVKIPLHSYRACNYTVEPDVSTASYFLAAAALTSGHITLPGIKRQMLQGDSQFIAVLEMMGAEVSETASGISLIGPAQLKGLGQIDMRSFSDTFMTLAALLAFSDRPTTITGLGHTRLQESDRILAIATGLSRLAVTVETTENSLTVYPSQPKGNQISSYNDHRIAMSLALIGLKIPGVVIEGAECVKKTCPDYFERLKAL